MRPLVSRQLSESGNAVLEFVVFFAAALILIVGLTLNFEANLRGRTAALTIATQSLRAWQIYSDRNVAQRVAAEAAAVFLLNSSQWSARYEIDCSTHYGFMRVTASVGGVIERAQGSC